MKRIVLAVLTIVTLVSTVHANEIEVRVNGNIENLEITQNEFGESQRDMLRAIKKLNKAVRQLQRRVFELELDSWRPARKMYQCSVTAISGITYTSDLIETKTQAFADVKNQCLRKENYFNCNYGGEVNCEVVGR